MERLRQMFAFPMLATVVWLLWVLGQQTSIDGMAVMLALLLLVCACVWCAPRWVLGGKPRRQFRLVGRMARGGCVCAPL